MSDDLKNLLDTDILRIAGLENTSPDLKERALAEAKNAILQAVARRIRSRITPEQQEEFEKLFGAEDDTLTQEDIRFLKEHVSDLDALILEETLAFKKGVLDTVETIQKKSADESQKINEILNGLKD